MVIGYQVVQDAVALPCGLATDTLAAAVLIALAHLRLDIAPVVRRDAPLHRSPNAGWPEAAMAVCLNVSLAGPRSYDGRVRHFALVHPEGAADLDRLIMPDLAGMFTR